MNSFLRAARFSLGLVVFLAVLIVLPAVYFGVVKQWQVIFLSFSYLVFFLGSIGRVFRYGELTRREADEQVKSLSGSLALFVSAIGLLVVHWLALYDFSHLADKSVDHTGMLSLSAAILIIAAIVVNQLAVTTLGKLFDRLTIKSDHQLVKTGIYSVLRHPIYLSYILLFTGLCVMLKSLVSLGVLAVVCTVWFSSRIAIEEEMLINKFADEYRDYQQTTKKLIPFIY